MQSKRSLLFLTVLLIAGALNAKVLVLKPESLEKYQCSICFEKFEGEGTAVHMSIYIEDENMPEGVARCRVALFDDDINLVYWDDGDIACGSGCIAKSLTIQKSLLYHSSIKIAPPHFGNSYRIDFSDFDKQIRTALETQQSIVLNPLESSFF